MKRRRTFIIGAGVGLLLAATIIAGPGDRTGDRGPRGTLALRRTLSRLGYDVRRADDPPPPPATFILVADLRDSDGAAELQQWVEAGGRLVVADPESLALSLFGVGPEARIGALGPESLKPGCAAHPAAGVRRIVVRGGEASLGAADPSAIACFPARRGSFVVSVRAGDGEAIFLGGPSPLTNELLRRADNMAFAAGLADSRGPVVFGTPLPEGAPQAAPSGLWASLPTAAKAAVVQLVLALVLYALVRARRVGRAITESPRTPIPAGELVRATAQLLRSAKASGHASRLMRDHATRRVAARLGFGPSEAAGLARSRAGELGDKARDALTGADARTDDELIALGRTIEETRRDLEGASR